MKRHTESLEEEILTRLYSGTRNVTELVEEISYLKKVSLQGVYKALRQLRTEEVVIVHKHTISLSMVWVVNEREKLLFAEEAHRSATYLEDIRMGRQKRIKFTFRTLNEIELFWTHSYLLLSEHIQNDVCSYVIHPHDWYMYVRYDTDAYWVKKHIESARVSRTILTHAGALDRVVIRARKKKLGNLFEYTLGENPLGQKNTTYYNIIGAYIFTAHFDVHIEKELDTFIEKYETLPLSVESQKEIDHIVRMKGKFTLTIEKSEKKAEEMRRKVKKYFEF